MTNTRYKMFKSGKMWMVAGAAALAMVPAAAQSANADNVIAAPTADAAKTTDAAKHETAKPGEKPVPEGTVTNTTTNTDGSKTTTTTTTTDQKNADGSMTQTYKTHEETVSTVTHTPASKNQINANGITDGTDQLYKFEANGKAQTFTVTGDRTKAFPEAMGTDLAHSQVNFKVVTAAGDPNGAGKVMAEGTLYANKAGENTATFTFTPEVNGHYAFEFEQAPLSADIGEGNDIVWNDIKVTSTKTVTSDTVTYKDFPADKPAPTPTPDSTSESTTPSSQSTASQSTASESTAPASTSTSSSATPAKPAAKPVAPAAKKAESALPATAEKASNNEAGLIALAAASVAASFGVLSYKRKH